MTEIKAGTLLMADVVRVVYLDFTLDTPEQPRYRYKIEVIRNQQGQFGTQLWSLEWYELRPKALENFPEQDQQSCENFYVLNDYWLDTENIWKDTAEEALNTLLRRLENAFSCSFQSI